MEHNGTVVADTEVVSVVDNVDFSRFDLRVDDQLVGILSYTDCDGPALALMHTVVKEEFGDHGWAAVLVREALEALRDNDVPVIPVCTYVQRFLANNTEFLDMVAADA